MNGLLSHFFLSKYFDPFLKTAEVFYMVKAGKKQQEDKLFAPMLLTFRLSAILDYNTQPYLFAYKHQLN